MSKISSEMLNQTLQLISLTRQTALEQGKAQEAEKMAPVENKLRGIAADAEQERPRGRGTSALRGSDFQRLLAIKEGEGSGESKTNYDQDRNRVIQSMASGGMTALDIARQMGMTSEEVEMVVSLGRKSSHD